MPDLHRRLIPAGPLLALAAGLGSCSEPEPPARNLLLIAVDTLRADHLGAYGYERPTSPELDRFFETAVLFEEAHSTSSWTLPSFTSLMTSLYTSTHGCWGYRSQLDSSFTTLAEVLYDAGYDTGAVVSHTFVGSRYGLHQGFEDYDEELVSDNEFESHRAITSPRVTEKALAMLEDAAAGDRPWFLWIHYFDPHWEYKFHAGFTDQFGTGRMDGYDGEIAFVDRHIGQLLRRVEELGLSEETVVAFVADHGEAFMEHGFEGHGQSLHREVERVPFALQVPGVKPRRVPNPVSVVDFAPTVLPLLGVPAPDTPRSGRNLANLLTGDGLEDRGLLQELRLGLRPVDVEAYLRGRWKLIVETPREEGATGKVMLFDRIADPDETNDLANQHADIVAELTESLKQAVADSSAIAASFAASSELDLSPEEIERLRALGYVGDDDRTEPKRGK